MIISVFNDSPYARAHEKAKNPNMTLANNPLAEGAGNCAECERINRNMDRLERDAELRRNSATGRVYAGMMNTRFGG